MKKTFRGLASVIGMVAFFCAGFFVNTACAFRGYQPSIPAAADKMRKYKK